MVQNVKEQLSSISALGLLDAEGRKEFWASLALKYTKGLGARTIKKLLVFFGSAYEAVINTSSWKDAGVGEDKVQSLHSDEWRHGAQAEWNAVRGCYGKVVLWTDHEYPELLREIPDPPLFLYTRGDIELLSNPAIAIVGTRNCSFEGIRAAQIIAKELSFAGITVVSGMAVGIDREVHLSAVGLSGSTIAVLGSGIDVNYPKQNADVREKIVESGLIISEHAPGTKPEPSFFPIRNRIISGISLGVVVIEAALRSGSLITARFALEQNRSIYAIPGLLGSPFSEGCQDLIRQGARPIFSIQDILEDLGGVFMDYVKTPHSTKLPSSDQQLKPVESIDRDYTGLDVVSMNVIKALAETPKDLEHLCQELQEPVEALSSTLVMLEVRGFIRRLPNTQYVVV